MRFYIRYGSENIEIEADNAIQAVIKIIDSGYDISSNAEFKIITYSVPEDTHVTES